MVFLSYNTLHDNMMIALLQNRNSWQSACCVIFGDSVCRRCLFILCTFQHNPLLVGLSYVAQVRIRTNNYWLNWNFSEIPKFNFSKDLEIYANMEVDTICMLVLSLIGILITLFITVSIIIYKISFIIVDIVAKYLFKTSKI